MPNSTYARTPGAASQFTQPSPGDQPVSAGPRALVEDYSPVDINGPVQRGKRPLRPTYLRLQQRLLSVLPGSEATNLLVDTYFDRAHWFMLVFRQQKFRQQLRQLQNDPYLHQDGGTSTAGFIAVLLPVVCIGLQYLGEYRENLLATYGIRREALQHEIIAALEESFLNIVSLGSLEAVQSCVLLGTFYLYHSESAMAWSICGCALRIAQAIKLHRSWPPSDGKQYSQSDRILQQISERKRCWWALYEVETFCCMLYGYTCSIRDEDCDMDFLTHQGEDLIEGHPEARPTPAFTLLSYKVNMSKLSVILKTALSKLYGHGTGPQNSARRNIRPGEMQQELFSSIGYLNRRLDLWHTELPPELTIHTPDHSGYENIDQSERDVGGSGQPFDSNIVQLQALALKLAYENAQILVNRPLFTYKLNRMPGHIRQSKTPDGRDVENSHAVQESFRICRQAALRTAEIGEDSAFKFAFRSFAAAFMSTHLFTAGVTLCLSAIIEPLTEHATQAKVGLQKLFSLQNDPTSEPLASPHVTKVLKRLIRLILEKELLDILGPKRQTALQTVGTRQASPKNHVNNASDDCSQVHRDGSAQPPGTNVPVATWDNRNAISNADSHDGNYMPNDVVQDDANGNSVRPRALYDQSKLTHI